MHKGNCNYLYHTVNSCKLSCTWAYILFPCLLKTSLLKLTELLAPEFGSQCWLNAILLFGAFFFFSKRILLVAFSSFPYCYSVAMWNKFQGQAITLLTFLITPLLWAKNQSESGMSMEASSNNACLSWGSGWALLSYVISHLCCFTPTFDFFLKRVLSLKPNNHEIVQTINSRLMHISPHTCWIAASCLRNPYSL